MIYSLLKASCCFFTTTWPWQGGWSKMFLPPTQKGATARESVKCANNPADAM